MSATAVAGASAIGGDLGRIVGAANVEIRPTALVPYRTDATFGFSGIPQAVVRPGSTDEVYVEVPGAGDCCGAAGTYAILRRRESRRILEAKLAALAELNLDFLAVVNPGCQRQLIAGLRRARLRTRVLHLAELAAMAQAESAGR
jgi:cysteine-rich protein